MADDPSRRLAELERWRDRVDGVTTGGAPVRLHDLEAIVAEMRGAVKTFRWFAAITATAVSLLTIYAFIRGPV